MYYTKIKLGVIIIIYIEDTSNTADKGRVALKKRIPSYIFMYLNNFGIK